MDLTSLTRLNRLGIARLVPRPVQNASHLSEIGALHVFHAHYSQLPGEFMSWHQPPVYYHIRSIHIEPRSWSTDLSLCFLSLYSVSFALGFLSVLDLSYICLASIWYPFCIRFRARFTCHMRFTRWCYIGRSVLHRYKPRV